MKKLEIVKIDNYNYTLKDSQDNTYELNLEFYNLTQKPQIGEYIFMNEALLKSNIPLSFDVLNSKYGKYITDSHDEDLIVLIIDNEKICLKRVYG